MRRTLLALTLFIPAAPVVAAPLPPAVASEPTARARDEAQSVASQIVNVAARAAETSIRPLEADVLLVSAVRAWYEATRQPVPGGLAADFAAVTDDPARLSALVARHRALLADQPALAEPRGLILGLQAIGRAIDPFSGPAPPNRVFVGRGDETTTGGGFELSSDPDLLAAVTEAGAPAVPAPPWRVQHVTPGGPGQRAGLRPGDVIVAVNGKNASDPAAATALRSLLPPSSSRFDDPFEQPPGGGDARAILSVRREGKADPLELKLSGNSFIPETVFGVRRQPDGNWDFWADHKARLGYIRIGAIGRQTPDQLGAALGRLRGEARGLVIDLRWCPGGYLNQAIQLVRPFLKEGEIATSVSRNLNEPTRIVELEQTYRVDFHDAELSALPLVVLVGPETSGGGELLAASLQDNGRAVVVGMRTRGKGSIQTELQSVLPGLSFKVTSGRFVRPSRKNLDRTAAGSGDEWGVKPDKGCELPISPELARRTKHDWILHALRPGDSREALPLDEPGRDPQFEGALRILARKLEDASAKK